MTTTPTGWWILPSLPNWYATLRRECFAVSLPPPLPPLLLRQESQRLQCHRRHLSRRLHHHRSRRYRSLRRKAASGFRRRRLHHHIFLPMRPLLRTDGKTRIGARRVRTAISSGRQTPVGSGKSADIGHLAPTPEGCRPRSEPRIYNAVGAPPCSSPWAWISQPCDGRRPASLLLETGLRCGQSAVSAHQRRTVAAAAPAAAFWVIFWMRAS